MPRMMQLVCVIALGYSTFLASNVPATGPAGVDPDAVRLFRARALSQSEIMRWALADESVDAKLRAELMHLLDDYSAKVDAEAEQIRKNPPPLKELTQRARALEAEFSKGPFAQKVNANLQVRQLLERRGNIVINVSLTLTSERQKLVAAALKAGLPADREAEAATIVDEAYRQLKSRGETLDAGRRQISALPAGDEKELAIAAGQADGQAEMFRLARSAYDQLRKLLPPERYEAFDQALPRPGW